LIAAGEAAMVLGVSTTRGAAMNTQLNALMAGERLGDLLRHAGHARVARSLPPGLRSDAHAPSAAGSPTVSRSSERPGHGRDALAHPPGRHAGAAVTRSAAG
jgi:hypothetical protein